MWQYLSCPQVQQTETGRTFFLRCQFCIVRQPRLPASVDNMHWRSASVFRRARSGPHPERFEFKLDQVCVSAAPKCKLWCQRVLRRQFCVPCTPREDNEAEVSFLCQACVKASVRSKSLLKLASKLLLTIAAWGATSVLHCETWRPNIVLTIAVELALRRSAALRH